MYPFFVGRSLYTEGFRVPYTPSSTVVKNLEQTKTNGNSTFWDGWLKVIIIFGIPAPVIEVRNSVITFFCER